MNARSRSTGLTLSLVTLLAAGGAAALVACLNPQPLPPDEKSAGESGGSSGSEFGDGTSSPAPEKNEDPAGSSSGSSGVSATPPVDGGADGGDAGR